METKQKRKRINTKKSSEPILVYSTTQNSHFNSKQDYKSQTVRQYYAK